MSPALEPSLAWGGYGTSPIRATVSRHQTARPGSLTTPPPLVSSKPTRTGASGLRLRVSTRSTQPGAVQPLHQAEEHPLPRGQEVEGSDAAGGDTPDLFAHLVMDVGGGHHRPGAFDAGLVFQSAQDSALASVQLATDTGVHSKTSWGRTGEGREAPRLFEKTRGFSSSSASACLKLRLVED